ncbi:NIT1 amidase, partial [Calcarius ornatus]|nr:NIT1 amidase [Calcarius ornatus]
VPLSLTVSPPHSPVAMAASPDPSASPGGLVAVAQVTSTGDKEHNWRQCSALVRRAAAAGARAVFLPEGFDFIGDSPQHSLQLAEPLHGDTVGRYRQLARECDVWLSLGGFHERGQDWDSTGRIYNCHLLLDNSVSPMSPPVPSWGWPCAMTCVSRSWPRVSPGVPNVPNVLSPPQLGLAVCYDLRFPELAQALRGAGAQILTFPSAFTVPTGAAHWEVLLRARAIECQCYVVAAAQTGRHNAARASFGHSLVADPWGAVVAQCHEGPGLCLAHIDLPYLEQVRRELPVHGHRRGDIYGT